MATQICQVGGRFSRCSNTAAHSCQYCGRSFCDQHCHFVGGHDAVCTRKRCALKHDDLAAHVAYRERVRQRNSAGLCGVEACGPHPGYECSLCHGHFCAEHLKERLYPFHEGWLTIDRPVSVCPSCWERRRVWRSK